MLLLAAAALSVAVSVSVSGLHLLPMLTCEPAAGRTKKKRTPHAGRFPAFALCSRRMNARQLTCSNHHRVYNDITTPQHCYRNYPRCVSFRVSFASCVVRNKNALVAQRTAHTFLNCNFLRLRQRSFCSFVCVFCVCVDVEHNRETQERNVIAIKVLSRV